MVCATSKLAKTTLLYRDLRDLRPPACKIPYDRQFFKFRASIHRGILSHDYIGNVEKRINVSKITHDLLHNQKLRYSVITLTRYVGLRVSGYTE